MKKPKKRKMFKPNDFSDTEKRYVVFQDKLYSKGYNQACDAWEAWLPNINELIEIIRKHTGTFYNVPDPVRGKTDIDYTNITGLAKAISERLGK